MKPYAGPLLPGPGTRRALVALVVIAAVATTLPALVVYRLVIDPAPPTPVARIIAIDPGPPTNIALFTPKGWSARARVFLHCRGAAGRGPEIASEGSEPISLTVELPPDTYRCRAGFTRDGDPWGEPTGIIPLVVPPTPAPASPAP